MNEARHPKVTSSHLGRDAYLYVRQATLRQAFENAKRLQRQLQQQAAALGWPVERVIVIESDLGKSGSGRIHRQGFEELVSQVKLGRVGIIMALEPSRLSRNLADWRRLLDACAVSNTLLLDQDGLYDPGDVNDHVLLGRDVTLPRRVGYSPSKKEALV